MACALRLRHAAVGGVAIFLAVEQVGDGCRDLYALADVEGQLRVEHQHLFVSSFLDLVAIEFSPVFT